MASTFVLGNESLQYTASTIGTRFRMYFAAFNPIQVTVQSQDIQTDQYGQYINPPNVDLLASHKAPYAPQPNFGPNRIGFVGEPLFFDGSRSTQRGNLSVSSYSWSISAVSGSYSAQYFSHPYAGANAQCQFVFQFPGLYILKLTVTDRFGSSTTGTRQIRIYPNRELTPAGVIAVDSLTGDLSSGGWSCSVTLARDEVSVALPDSLPIGWYQPVGIYVETEYEIAPGIWQRKTIGTAPIPGQTYNDARMVFNGYIQQGSADQTVDQDTVQLSLSGPQMILQQAGVHNIGYYNTTYNTRNSAGMPTSLNTSSVGIGQLVADLTSEDLYRSLLVDHSNFGLYHDVCIWRDMLTASDAIATWTPGSSFSGQNLAPGQANSAYYLTYSTLTANEGKIWDAITTMAQNEYADVWCDQWGTFCVGPMINMRGYELIHQPTVYGWTFLGEILNYTSELAGNNTTASQSAYLNFLFGPNLQPQAQESSTGVTRSLGQLVGPPLLCHFSDVPITDPDSSPPNDQNIFAWVAANWPQDLAIHPLHSVVTENYTTRTDFVKLVATLVTGTTVWSSWYPTNTFDANGLMQQATAAGDWDVETSLLLPDALINGDATARARSWQYLWELARRRWNVLNQIYTVQIDGGMWPWLSLHDLFYYTRQYPITGPKFFAMPCFVQTITHTINLAQGSWTTSLTGGQVTSLTVTPMITPPMNPPANNS